MRTDAELVQQSIMLILGAQPFERSPRIQLFQRLGLGDRLEHIADRQRQNKETVIAEFQAIQACLNQCREMELNSLSD